MGDRVPAQLRSDVTDCMIRYASAVDAKDLAALRELLAPDVVLVRPDGTYHGVEAFLATYAAAIGPGTPSSRHLVTNIDPRPEGDVIHVRAYFLAAFDEGAAARLVWGRYEDVLAERDGRLVFQKKVNVVERSLRINGGANG